jgi:predicted trehalose synthase
MADRSGAPAPSRRNLSVGCLYAAEGDAPRRPRATVPPPDDFRLLLPAFVLDKATYELAYESNRRPDWVRIPLAGMLKLLG